MSATLAKKPYVPAPAVNDLDAPPVAPAAADEAAARAVLDAPATTDPVGLVELRADDLEAEAEPLLLALAVAEAPEADAEAEAEDPAAGAEATRPLVAIPSVRVESEVISSGNEEKVHLRVATDWRWC